MTEERLQEIRTDYDTNMPNTLGRWHGYIGELLAEIERMRPVVEAIIMQHQLNWLPNKDWQDLEPGFRAIDKTKAAVRTYLAQMSKLSK